MSNLLVVEGVSLTYQIDPLITAVTIVVNPATSTISQKVKCSGNRVYKEVGFIISGLTTSTGFVQTAPVNGSIVGTTVKVLGDNDSLVTETDFEGPITIDGNIGQNPATYPITIIIDDPNQDKVRAV